MNEQPGQTSSFDDIYARSKFFRYLALIAGLLAWTFDGVEQGVYGIMTRPALKELVPGIQTLVDQQAELKKELDELIEREGANEAEIKELLQDKTLQQLLEMETELVDEQQVLQEQIDEIKDAQTANPQQLMLIRESTGTLLKNEIDGPVGTYFGWALAMWLWGAACGGVIFGRWGDRYGRVRCLIFAVIVYSGFTGLSAFSTHWSHLIICRFFGAIGLGGAWPLSVALIVETWPDKYRAVLAGLMGMGANVGYFIAAKYSGWMSAAGYDWRWVIGMGCVFGLSSLIVIIPTPEPGKWRQSRLKKQHSSLGDLFHKNYRRSTIVGSLLSTVALLGTWGSFLWLSTYVDQISEGTKFADTARSDIAAWQSYGQIIGGFLGGMLAGWMGNKKSWIFLCITAWASVFALFYFNEVFDYQMMFMGAFAGLFVTAYFGWLPKFLPELFPTRIRATGQGFSFNIGRVLAGVGVLGTGWVVDAFGGDFQKGAMTMCSIYLFGLIVILFAPDTKGKMISDEDDERMMKVGEVAQES